MKSEFYIRVKGETVTEAIDSHVSGYQTLAEALAETPVYNEEWTILEVREYGPERAKMYAH